MGRFNFNQEDINRGKLVDPGWYPCEITKYEAKKAKTDNSNLDVFYAKIISSDEELAGIPLFFQFSEKTPGFAIPFVEALTGQKVKAGDEFEIGQNCVGKQLDLLVTRGEWNNKPKNDVTGYRPLGDGPVAE